MRNKYLFVTAFYFFSFLLLSCGGGKQKEVKIGTQIWTLNNLDVDHFRNGDKIPEVKTEDEWVKYGKEGKPAWCYFDNDPANGKKYGKLYNWHAVNDSRGLAPEGWHIPTNEEWAILTSFLGEEKTCGLKMKSKSGWADDDKVSGNGNNESGFDGLPSGYRGRQGGFNSNGKVALWWSTTKGNTDGALTTGLNYRTGFVEKDNNEWISGISIRCLKDISSNIVADNKSSKFIGAWKQKGQFNREIDRIVLRIESFGENFSVKIGGMDSYVEQKTASYSKEFDKLIISTGKGTLDIIYNPQTNTILFSGSEYEKAH
jgi:uncharacterized protein (TIGR02145 family)